MGNLLDKIKTKLEFSKRDSKTFTGQPADEIQLHPSTGSIKEAAEKREVFTFGRFNPPTTGHKKLIDSVKSIADKQGAGHTIFASQTQDKAKNPLPHDEKVGFMKKMFPDTNVHGDTNVKTVLDAAKHMQAKGVTHGTLVVGSDRVDEFHNLLSKYNKPTTDPDYDPTKHFHIPHLTVVSAGHRDPDAEGVEGMSASKLRSHAATGNFKEFKKGVPNKEQAQPMFDSIRKHMRISEQVETPERIARISDASKEARKSHEAEHRRSSLRTISKRVKPAKTLSIKLPSDMAQNPYEETRYVIPFQRDNMAKDHAPVDVGHSKDLDPQDKNKQLKRRKSLKLFRSFVEGSDGDTYGAAQDKAPGPIGSQLSNVSTSNPIPKATKPKLAKKLTTEAKQEIMKPEYRSGLSDSTATARKAHWKKLEKYSDKDPRAYAPAPGDAAAKTKESKYTKAYHDKFGESIEIDESSESGLASKASKSGISIGTLRKVYRRGVAAWNSGHRPGTTPQQWGMARVNSYIAKGKGTYGGADKDLHEDDLEEGGLWANIHAKRERIKRGSGEHMRKPGSKGAPSQMAIKTAAEETVHEIYVGVSFPKLLSKKKGPNPYDDANLKPGKSFSAALKHLDTYKKANPEKFKEENVNEMGMFGSDLAISDKPSAFPNISTPVPPVVAPKKKMKKEDNELPFPGPYRPITNKDRFGNTIKPKNQAARLAKQGMKNVKTEEADEEGGMAKNELKTAARAAKELGSKLKTKSQLPAWVQSKITKGSDQLDTVADYMKSGK